MRELSSSYNVVKVVRGRIALKQSQGRIFALLSKYWEGNCGTSRTQGAQTGHLRIGRTR